MGSHRQVTLPLEEFWHLVSRIPVGELPPRHRCWTGNDESQRNHNGRIPRGENPVYLELRWRKGREEPAYLIGGYMIDVEALAEDKYLSADPSGGIRLKFFHGKDDLIYIGRGHMKKKIPIGTVVM